MRLLISLSALLLSTLFVQMGIGSLRPFDAISGQALGFSPVEIGLLASGHFAGFLLGCIFGPYLVRRAGHSRAFAVMAGAAVISIIAHPLIPDAMFWAAIRVLSGFSVAGCYTLIESWLQAKITNDIRGRVFSIYRLVDMSGQIMANAVIATLTPASYVSYNLIAIIMCLAILPLALTQSKEPELPEKVSYQPLFALRISPLAGLGVIVAGLSTATFGSVGPIYAIAVGLDLSQIALFLVVSTVGGMISQLPAGMLADKVPRRTVLLIFSVMASVTCLSMMLPVTNSVVGGIALVYVMSFLFGFDISDLLGLRRARLRLRRPGQNDDAERLPDLPLRHGRHRLPPHGRLDYRRIRSSHDVQPDRGGPHRAHGLYRLPQLRTPGGAAAQIRLHPANLDVHCQHPQAAQIQRKRQVSMMGARPRYASRFSAKGLHVKECRTYVWRHGVGPATITGAPGYGG